MKWVLAILTTLFAAGCGPDFDPASLVTRTRVIGAQVQASGGDNRASVAPGESAQVTWLVTAPDGSAGVPATLSWAFALCAPAGGDDLGCTAAPLATFQGTGSPPVVPITAPDTAALGGADHLTMFGRICDAGTPVFDANGNPGCSEGTGTTASLAIQVQGPDDANHNPTADRGLALDGQPWATAATDPCAAGPRLTADGGDHVVELVTAGSDRESYTTSAGSPPVATAARETLQVSFFTTAGKLKSPFAFVEANDPATEAPVSVKWTAPKAADVATPTPVIFTFVVRDGRGGIDWTSRSACVAPL